MKSNLVIIPEAILYIKSIHYILLKNMGYYTATKGLVLIDISSSYTITNTAYYIFI
jgi:hypothetical protein